jgi:hypothetical protein
VGRVDELGILLGRPVRDLEQLPAVVVEPNRERAAGGRVDRGRERGRWWLGRLDRRERRRLGHCVSSSAAIVTTGGGDVKGDPASLQDGFRRRDHDPP